MRSTLRVFVAEDCPNCVEARTIAARVEQDYPGLAVEVVDIGDEQSIEQSLSTFSSHMKNIVNITEKADHESLILLDELGAGTDPLEGEALGCAIMESLHAQGAPGLRLIATSHFAGLKELAASSDGMTNARMEFNAVTLEPTFELTMGASGSSQAFPVAERRRHFP